ncbi:MAG: CSLREA domain-containing protein, partial [Ilumatobacteraceae bacterium]
MTRRRSIAVGVLTSAGLVLAAPLVAHAADDFEVDTTADTPDANPGDGECADANGECSLRAAVEESNAQGGSTTIELQGATYVLSEGELSVMADIELEGDGSTVDGDQQSRVFSIDAGASLYVDELTVKGGFVEGGADAIVGSGGGFANAGTLHLVDSTVTENVADGPMASGGGILNTGELLVEDSAIFNNLATRAGGGIEANGGVTVIDGSQLSGNSTGPGPGNGGGLHLTGAGEVRVDRSAINANNAEAEGGGLWNSATGTMVVDRSTFSQNVAAGVDPDQGGGALFNDGGSLVVTRSVLSDNSAPGPGGSGGGILNNKGTLEVSRTTIEGNEARRAGGGIEANIGQTSLDRVELLDNETGNNPGNGGGLHITGAGQVDIDRGTVTGNSATNEGGGLWNSSTGTLIATRTKVTGNTAPAGPDVFNDGGTFTLNGQTVPPS